MSFLTSKSISAAALCIAMSVAPAFADVLLFQTATPDPGALLNDNTFALQGDGTTDGGGFFGGSLFFGTDFTISAVTTITSVGAMFADTARQSHSGPNGDGSIFGAIAQVDPVTGLPTQPVESLASIVLGSVVFTPATDGDTSAKLTVTLQPGTYGLVFGSGLFGATGVADLLAGNDPVGSQAIFVNNFSPFASDPSDTDVRLFATAVPEPGALSLLLSGSLLLAGVARRRR